MTRARASLSIVGDKIRVVGVDDFEPAGVVATDLEAGSGVQGGHGWISNALDTTKK